MRIISKISFLIGLVAVICGLFFCKKDQVNYRLRVDKSSEVRTNDWVKEQKAQIKPSSKTWKWDNISFIPQGKLSILQFVNSKIGWLATEHGVLFRTKDGGRIWERVNVGAKGDYISSFFFINESIGWVALGNEVQAENGLRDLISHTTDGWKTNNIIYLDDSVRINKIFFVNELEGWIGGAKLIKDKSIGSDFYLIYTKNQGHNWEDISDSINPIVSRFLFGGSVEDIYAISPSNAIIMGGEGQIVITTNGDKNWSQAAPVLKELPQTIFQKILSWQGNKICLVSGADSREGIWGTIACLDQTSSWSKHTIDGFFLKDAILLSDKEIMASGSTLSPGKAEIGGIESNRDGVILYSSDLGLNWELIYRSSTAKCVNALVLTETRKIFATCDNGLILESTIGR